MVVRIKGKTMLLAAAGLGMVAMVYFTAKGSPEAAKKKEAALQKKREETGDPNAQLTFVESVRAQYGSYLPALLSGLVVVGGVVGSEVINEKNMKKAEKAFDDFKEMTDKLDGKGASKAIEKAVELKKLDEKKKKPWEEKENFRIMFQGHSIQFESTRASVIEAFYEANRYFQGRGILTFNEFLMYLGQESVPEGDDRGWEVYVGEAVYGYSWIDFGLKECEDEPWITEIYMAVYPHFFDEDECVDEIESSGVMKLSSGANEKEPTELGANDGKD